MDRFEVAGRFEVTETADLLSALEVIEAQPLASRADAYASLHDALARDLDAGPTSPSS